MRPENFDVHELIDYLAWTDMTINEGLIQINNDMREEDLTGKDRQAIDDNIFCCSGCFYWSELEDANYSDNGNVCNDCCKGKDEEE